MRVSNISKKKSPISLLESSDCISAVKHDTLHGLIFWCLMNAVVGDLGVI